MQTPDGSVLIRAELDTLDVTRGIAEMKAALSELRTYAQKQLSAVRTQALREGEALTGGISSLASRLIGALTGGISLGKTAVGGALRSVLTAALQAGGDTAPRFEGIGRNVISGIIAGIRGTASSLWSTLRAVADNILSTLRSALDIRSPSRVMRDEIGRQIGAGIAQGIRDGEREVSRAADALAAELDAGIEGHALTVPITPETVPMSVTPTRPAAPRSSAPQPTAMQAAAMQTTVSPSYVTQKAAMQPAAITGAAELVRPAAGGRGADPGLSLIGAAKQLLRAVPTPAAPMRTYRAAAGQEIPAPTPAKEGGGTMNNTFVFNKPVETPARHARVIRETMEEMLYGV